MKKITIDEQIEDANNRRRMYLELANQEGLRYERLLRKKYPRAYDGLLKNKIDS